MSNNSSTFPNVGLSVDCWPAPDFAVLYDGTTTGNPTVSMGMLNFIGGLTLHGTRGVGYGQSGQVFGIPFQRILPGGKGVKIINCSTKQNKRVRFKCCGAECGEAEQDMVIQASIIETCRNLEWDSWQFDYRIAFDPKCNLTCKEKLDKMAYEINTRDKNPLFSAQVLQDANNDWVLDLVSVDEYNFKVDYKSGLIGGEEVVGYYENRLMASQMKKWFPKEIFDSCSADECFNYIEIHWIENQAESNGSLASRFSLDPYTEVQKKRSVIVVFSSAAATQRTNLLTELYAAGSKFDSKIVSATPAVSVQAAYDYVIVREDAGDAAALTAVNTAYTTEIVPIARAKYKGGISYYVLTTASATAPTALSDDQIFQGVYVDGLFEACPPVTT